MAEIKSFPNNQDEYSGAEDVMRWLHGRTSGVFAASGNAAVAALATPGMAVTVSDGTGWMANAANDGVVWWNDTESTGGEKLQLAIDAADGALNRIDRIIVEWKTTNYVDRPEIKVLKGTAGSSAAAPALTNNSTKRQISLAQVYVAAGTTAITASMITDERQDNSVCGLVTETLSIDTSVINAQFSALLDQLRTAIEQASGGVLPDGSVTLDKLAPGAKYGHEVYIDSNSNVLNAWGYGLMWVDAVTITLSSTVAAGIDSNWKCRFFAANENGFDFTWTGVNVYNTASGTSSTNGTIHVPKYRYLDLQKVASNDDLWIISGSYADRYITSGTADPSGGSDGDIYLQYEA